MGNKCMKPDNTPKEEDAPKEEDLPKDVLYESPIGIYERYERYGPNVRNEVDELKELDVDSIEFADKYKFIFEKIGGYHALGSPDNSKLLMLKDLPENRRTAKCIVKMALERYYSMNDMFKN